MIDPTVTLRPYAPADEADAIELWRQTWQAAYPHFDFTARLDWWRDRWRTELVPVATIVVAERSDGLVGFVTVDPSNGYLGDCSGVRPGQRWVCPCPNECYWSS